MNKQRRDELSAILEELSALRARVEDCQNEEASE